MNANHSIHQKTSNGISDTGDIAPFDSTQQQNKKPILLNGRIVGIVYGDTLKKVIAGSRHMLRKPPAIAFDLEALERAEYAGALRVVVTDSETGVQYRADITQIRAAGFVFNRGFGTQVALPLYAWTITRRGEIPAQQLKLWQQGGSYD